MTAHTIITAAISARHMRPGLTCACCRATGLIAEEIADAEFYPDAWLGDLDRLHGGRVCTVCANDHPPCTVCGHAVAPGEAHYHSGDPWCPDCHWAAE